MSGLTSSTSVECLRISQTSTQNDNHTDCNHLLIALSFLADTSKTLINIDYLISCTVMNICDCCGPLASYYTELSYSLRLPHLRFPNEYTDVLS